MGRGCSSGGAAISLTPQGLNGFGLEPTPSQLQVPAAASPDGAAGAQASPSSSHSEFVKFEQIPLFYQRG